MSKRPRFDSLYARLEADERLSLLARSLAEGDERDVAQLLKSAPSVCGFRWRILAALLVASVVERMLWASLYSTQRAYARLALRAAESRAKALAALDALSEGDFDEGELEAQARESVAALKQAQALAEEASQALAGSLAGCERFCDEALSQPLEVVLAGLGLFDDEQTSAARQARAILARAEVDDEASAFVEARESSLEALRLVYGSLGRQERAA